MFWTLVKGEISIGSINMKEKSAFLECFGDTPKLRFLDFLIGNHFLILT
jgi:hypothetical protein